MAIDAQELRAAIPEEMANASRWLLWRYVHREGKNKPDKVPFYVNGKMRNGTLDSEADQAQFGTLDKAIEECLFGWPDYDGIGFALGPDGTGNHWQGIDLDDLPDRPELHHIADELPGYTEQSPSGKGMHAIGYGRPFDALGSNDTGIEAYASGRFFTVTGSCAGLADPTDLADYVEGTLKPLHKRRNADTETPDPWVGLVTDDQRADLRSALAAIPSDDRQLWVSMGHALKTIGDSGRALWEEWSQKSEKYDPADAERVWASITPKGSEFTSVFAEAERHGWLNPKKTLPSARQEAVNATVNTDPLIPVDLTEPPALEATEWAIDGIIPKRHVTLLGGHGGAGKSILALAMAAHVATGTPWNGHDVEQGRVLFVSLEDDGPLVRHRLARVVSHIAPDRSTGDLPITVLDGTQGDGTLSVEVNEYGRRILHTAPAYNQVLAAAEGCALVIVDNASDGFDGDENHRRSVRQFMRLLADVAREHDVAMLLLVHIDKNAARNGGGRNSYSGSTAWHNSARSRLALVADEEKGIQLLHEKCNLAPLADPVPMAWNPDGILIPAGELPTATDVSGLLAKASAPDDAAILRAIREAIRRGDDIPTARTGPATTWHRLCTHTELPSWARNKANKPRFWQAVTRLQDAKHIAIENYQTRQRKPGQRFVIPECPKCEGDGCDWCRDGDQGGNSIGAPEAA